MKISGLQERQKSVRGLEKTLATKSASKSGSLSTVISG